MSPSLLLLLVVSTGVFAGIGYGYKKMEPIPQLLEFEMRLEYDKIERERKNKELLRPAYPDLCDRNATLAYMHEELTEGAHHFVFGRLDEAAECIATGLALSTNGRACARNLVENYTPEFIECVKNRVWRIAEAIHSQQNWEGAEIYRKEYLPFLEFHEEDNSLNFKRYKFSR